MIIRLYIIILLLLFALFVTSIVLRNMINPSNHHSSKPKNKTDKPLGAGNSHTYNRGTNSNFNFSNSYIYQNKVLDGNMINLNDGNNGVFMGKNGMTVRSGDKEIVMGENGITVRPLGDNSSNYDSHTNYNNQNNVEPKATYRETIEKFNSIVQEYIDGITYSSDYIFTAPAIFDTSIPTTGKFVDIMYKCQNKIETIAPSMYDNQADSNFIEMVDNVEKAWNEALDFARSNVSLAIPSKKHSVVKGLVNKILISGLDDNEGKLARDKLIEIMEGIEYKIPTVGVETDNVIFIDKKLNPSLILKSFDNVADIKQLQSKNQLAIEQ